jgi:hypothetical protein
MITQQELKKLIKYCPETGDIWFLPRDRSYFMTENQYKTWHSRFCGKAKLGNDGNGYQTICIDSRAYRAHRIAWLYMTGEHPKQIDHINHIRSDNRFCNLRNVEPRQNSMNRSMSKRNTSGVNGVSWNQRFGKWAARLGMNFERRFIGYFHNIEDAKAAIEEVMAEMGYHDNHGL